MPKYFQFKICGYYLYFTSHCVIECMHVLASDSRLTESGSAKFFVKGKWRRCIAGTWHTNRQRDTSYTGIY